MIFAPLPFQTSPSFTQIVNPGSNGFSLSVVARLDHPTIRELQLLRVGLAMIDRASDVYSRGTIQLITEGRGIHAYLGRQEAIVSFSVPEKTKTDPARLMVSLLKNPNFPEEAIASTLSSLKRGAGDYWINEVDWTPFALNAATNEDIAGAFHRVFRLDRMAIAESGPRASHNSAESWISETQDWPAPPDAPILDDPLLTPLLTNPGHISTGEIIGAPVTAASPDFYAKILALYALGAGKTSSLYRISREKNGWSYRQEAFLHEGATGLEPRLFVAMLPNSADESRLAQLKGQLLADAQAWTEQNRLNAMGLAEANLLRGNPFGPFLFGNRAIGEDPEQMLDFSLSWKVETGEEWSVPDLVNQLRKVNLADLKSAALHILESATTHYLPASEASESPS